MCAVVCSSETARLKIIMTGGELFSEWPLYAIGRKIQYDVFVNAMAIGSRERNHIAKIAFLRATCQRAEYSGQVVSQK